jgi:hypothetical protein
MTTLMVLYVVFLVLVAVLGCICIFCSEIPTAVERDTGYWNRQAESRCKADTLPCAPPSVLR